jgi:hypothetical protein
VREQEIVVMRNWKRVTEPGQSIAFVAALPTAP